VLGVQAAAGHLFTPDDNRIAGGHPLAVLSYDYWLPSPFATRFCRSSRCSNRHEISTLA
jgi:hypothetical protein